MLACVAYLDITWEISVPSVSHSRQDPVRCFNTHFMYGLATINLIWCMWSGVWTIRKNEHQWINWTKLFLCNSDSTNKLMRPIRGSRWIMTSLESRFFTSNFGFSKAILIFILELCLIMLLLKVFIYRTKRVVSMFYIIYTNSYKF